MKFPNFDTTRWRPVALMLLLAVPLLVGLRFTAEEFPNWDDSSFLEKIDDRYTLIVRYSSTDERWSSYVDRFFLLDGANGRLHKVQPPDYKSAGLTSGGQAFLRIMHDGRIARSRHASQWVVHVTEPKTNGTQTIAMQHGPPILVGDRFLLSQVSPDNEQVYWYDLQDPHLEAHFSPLATFNTELSPVPGSLDPIFFDLYSPAPQLMPVLEAADSDEADSSAPTDTDLPQPDQSSPENMDPDWEEEPPPRRPDWELELASLPTATPKPHVCFTQFAMLALYRITESGPIEIAHWPIGVEESFAAQYFVKADGPYLFCLSLDAETIDVHDASTGEIRQRIPFKTGLSPGSTDWRANRHVISIFNGTTWQAFDPNTGQILPCDPSVGIVLSVQGDRYLTLAPQKPDTPSTLAFHAWPMRLQVRHYPTGSILSSYLVPDHQASLSWAELTEDGQQFIMQTVNERLLTIDTLTGRIIKVTQAASWPYYTCILIMVLLVSWIAMWIRIADSASLPRLITMLVITAVVVAFLMMRLQLSGHPQLRLRLAVIAVLAISTAWSAELCQHLIRPGCSLLSRTLSVSAYLTCIYLIPFQLIHRYDTAETILACLLLHTCLAAFYFLLRLTGRLPPYPHSLLTKQFSLRAILVITTFTALAISGGYRQLWSRLHFLGLWETAALVAIVALALAVRHAYWLRIMIIAICLAVAYTVHIDRYAWAPWCWPLSMYLAFTSIACSFCVVPISGQGAAGKRPGGFGTRLPCGQIREY